MDWIIMHMRKMLAISFLALFVCFFPVLSASAEDIKIGFVDMQKAVSSTKEWKKEYANFKNDFQKEKGVISEKEKAIRQELEELNKQGFVLSPELKRQKEEAFGKNKREFERYVQDRNDEFSKREKELADKLMKKVIKIIQTLGKEKKLTMIVEQNTVFYSSTEADLTDLVIKAYDKANP